MGTLLFLNFIYGLEIVMKVYAFGLRRTFRFSDWVIKVEFFIQFYAVFEFVTFIISVVRREHDLFLMIEIQQLIILVRSLRITSFLMELQVWRNFLKAIQAFISPFLRIIMTLYSLYVIYASIGIMLFGGLINYESIKVLAANSNDVVDTEWVYLNFNDFYMAFNTLFGMMWENDWEQYVYMF